MNDEPRLTFFGKLVAFLIIAGCLAGAYFLLIRSPQASGGGSSAGGSKPGTGASGTPADPSASPSTGHSPSSSTPAASGEAVEIGIAYGSEKERWFTWAVEEFAKAPAGRNVKINLKKMGSIEGAMAILKDDQSIHVWSPASGLYLYNLTDEWGMKRAGENPIAKAEPLALTPMVFVMWEERYQAFQTKYGADGGVSFRSIEKAFKAKSGWAEIAGKPEWGFFKFGHTHPNQSNSGLMTLVLMAYDYHNKLSALSMADITNAGFQEWGTSLQRGVTGLSNSTGNMMKEMVQRGPSTYDALFVYENTAIDYLANAEGRWGKLRVVYPSKNAWNDNPYYVLNVPWSSKRQREAAGAFMDFLLSERAQQQALVHGFRPANVQVAINGPDSPFTRYKDYGLQIDVSSVCETPPGDVIRNLLIRWQQTRGN